MQARFFNRLQMAQGKLAVCLDLLLFDGGIQAQINYRVFFQISK